MSKRKLKPPPVSDLIDEAIIMIAQGMRGEKIPIAPNVLSTYLNMLVSVDKNAREAKATFSKIAPLMTDEQLDASIKAFVESATEDAKTP